MNKVQFWILNIVGGIGAILIFTNLIMARVNLGQYRANEETNQTLMGRQNEFNRVQQVQTTTRNLVGRIAEAGRGDASLSNLLVRFKLQIAPAPEAQSPPAPPPQPTPPQAPQLQPQPAPAKP